jgi:hypothetical protein
MGAAIAAWFAANAITAFQAAGAWLALRYSQSALRILLKIETLSQIFEEDPNKHRADGQPNQCQPVCGIEHARRSGCLNLRWTDVCSHSRPLLKEFDRD